MGMALGQSFFLLCCQNRKSGICKLPHRSDGSTFDISRFLPLWDQLFWTMRVWKHAHCLGSITCIYFSRLLWVNVSWYFLDYSSFDTVDARRGVVWCFEVDKNWRRDICNKTHCRVEFLVRGNFTITVWISWRFIESNNLLQKWWMDASQWPMWPHLSVETNNCK